VERPGDVADEQAVAQGEGGEEADLEGVQVRQRARLERQAAHGEQQAGGKGEQEPARDQQPPALLRQAGRRAGEVDEQRDPAQPHREQHEDDHGQQHLEVDLADRPFRLEALGGAAGRGGRDAEALLLPGGGGQAGDGPERPVAHGRDPRVRRPDAPGVEQIADRLPYPLLEL
jgi:hypothetical protein